MKNKPLFSVTKKDLRIEFYRASGKGGQNRNKRDTACRITHPESGAVGIGADQRSQEQNKQDAFKRMTDSYKFRQWHAKKVQEVIDQETAAEKVDKMMDKSNLKVEGKDERGRWTEEEK